MLTLLINRVQEGKEWRKAKYG